MLISKRIKKYGTSRTPGTGHVTDVYVIINIVCFERGKFIKYRIGVCVV